MLHNTKSLQPENIQLILLCVSSTLFAVNCFVFKMFSPALVKAAIVELSFILAQVGRGVSCSLYLSHTDTAVRA